MTLEVPRRVGFRPGRVWFREFLVWRRLYRTSILLNFGQPLMWLLTFGFALGAYVTLGRPGSYLGFVAPGLLVITAMNVVTFDTMFGSWVKTYEWGTFEDMITTPISAREIVAGIFIWEATRAVVFGGVFASVMLVLGLIRSPWALLLPVMLAGVGPLFAAPAMGWAVKCRNFQNLFYYTELAIAPMFFFSGAFFPVDRLPAYLQVLIWVTPLYHVVNISRALATGTVHPGLILDVAYPLLFIAALTPLTMRIITKHLSE